MLAVVVAVGIVAAAGALVAIVVRCPVKLVVPIQAPKAFFKPSLELPTRLPLERVALVEATQLADPWGQIPYLQLSHHPAAGVDRLKVLLLEMVEAAAERLVLQPQTLAELVLETKVRTAEMDATTGPIARVVVAVVHLLMAFRLLLLHQMAALDSHHQSRVAR